MRSDLVARILLCASAVSVAGAGPAWAVNVTIDYTYDTTNFFGSGNPDGSAAGAAARAAVEAAADYFSEVVVDSLSRIETPDDFESNVYEGVVSWTWQATFTHPTSGASVALNDLTIAEDEYRIYVGAQRISGASIGIGGSGGWGWNSSSNGEPFTSDEIEDINAITAEFGDDVANRDEPAGEFANWGGFMAFDSDGSPNWHYDHTTLPGATQSDFYSVALHELAHTLGFGVSSEWGSLVSGGLFLGSASYAANNNSYPAVSGGHWVANTQSTVFGASVPQEASLDPNIAGAQRKLITTLDAAALTDIGWSLVAPPGLIGDYNGDLVVDSADYAVWRTSLTTGPVVGSYSEWRSSYGATFTSAANAGPAPVPSPSAAGLALLASALGLVRRRPGGSPLPRA